MTDPIHQATTHIHCGQWETAAGILYRVLAEDSANTRALALMAICKWQMNDVDTAETAALQLTRAAPQDPAGHYLLAQIRLHSGALSEAHAAIRACLHCDPNSADALKLCVIIQRRMHDWRGARSTRRYLKLMHPFRPTNDSPLERLRRWRSSRPAQPCLMVFCQTA